jgi:AraC-like DNA-binding protein
VRIEAEGSDPAEAAAMFSSTYHGDGAWTVRETDRDFSYRHTAIGDSALTLRTSRFMGRLTGRIVPEGDYVVSWITAGDGVMDSVQGPSSAEVGRPFLFPTDRPFSFDMADFEQKLVHFDKTLLERVAAEHFGAGPGTLHFQPTPPDDAAVRSWRNTLALVSRTSLDADASPLLQAEMSRLAAMALLGMFRPKNTTLPAALHSASNSRLRAAVEFVHANAHLPITTTGIAASADLSIRALQEGFRRHLDTTPNAYLRNVRLDRVHDELSRGGGESVAQVARSWGFAHLGRFAAAYAERFGEQPHHTRSR